MDLLEDFWTFRRSYPGSRVAFRPVRTPRPRNAVRNLSGAAA